MATTPDLQEPLITAARAQAWHHTGTALLTLEAARTWLNEAGLLLFAPRGGSLGAPAPSLVEATLGTPRPTATLGETDLARTLAARLVGEGSALPLNLFGGPGDLPDFLVSTQAFPFIFTLRGDKGWKRPPETTGSVKVTPLGLRVYELLAEKGALTVSEAVSEAGREVTESAVARALGELWQLLRVIPVLQQGGGETRWELTTSRFLKAIKAGANAGQPTALSALISLYLGQVYMATEEEIAAFLSPLTARSRVRDALHGLSAGRQLTEGVVNGKTVLYIPDALPDFPAFAPEDAQPDEAESETTDDLAPAETADEPSAPRDRIQSFGQEGGRPQDRNLRGKPLGRGKEGGGAFRGSARPPRPGFSRGPRDGGARGGTDRPSFRPQTGERSGGREGAGRSFARPRPDAGGPSFSRPWEEERGSRPPRSRDEAGPSAEGATRSPRPGRTPREPRGDRPFGGAGGENARPPRRFGDRPSRPSPRTGSGSGEDPGRSRGGFPSRGDRPQKPFRERPAGDRPFRPRPEGDRPYRPKPEGGGDRPFRPRAGGSDRPFRPRPEGGDRAPRARSEGTDRPFRPRPEGGDRPYRARPEGGDRPFRPRPAGDRPFRPAGGSGERRGPGRPPSRFGSGGGSEARPERPRTGGPRSRPEGGGSETGRSRPSFGGGSSRPGQGRPARNGDRPQGRPAPRGGARPPAKRTGSKPPARPDRPARKPRPEDEA